MFLFLGLWQRGSRQRRFGRILQEPKITAVSLKGYKPRPVQCEYNKENITNHSLFYAKKIKQWYSDKQYSVLGLSFVSVLSIVDLSLICFAQHFEGLCICVCSLGDGIEVASRQSRHWADWLDGGRSRLLMKHIVEGVFFSEGDESSRIGVALALLIGSANECTIYRRYS